MTDNRDIHYQEFIKNWPVERLKTMTLDEYVIGAGTGTFCFFIECEN
jgi:hypothetical protein